MNDSGDKGPRFLAGCGSCLVQIIALIVVLSVIVFVVGLLFGWEYE